MTSKAAKVAAEAPAKGKAVTGMTAKTPVGGDGVRKPMGKSLGKPTGKKGGRP